MYLKSQLKYISDYDVSPHINKVTKSTRTRINVTLVTIWWHILDYLSLTELILYYTKIWWTLISEDELIIDAVNYRFESRRDHHFYPIFNFTNHIWNQKLLVQFVFGNNSKKLDISLFVSKLPWKTNFSGLSQRCFSLDK